MCDAINESKNISKLSKLKILRYVNKDVTVTYDIFFKNETFSLPQCSHERPFKDVKFTDNKIYDNGKEWKIEKYEYKQCPECGGDLVAMDRSRGERVCECGMTNKRVMMINDCDLDKQYSTEQLHYTGEGYTYDEKKVLKSVRKAKHKTRTRVKETEKGNRGVYLKNNTKTDDWRKKQNILMIETISSQLLMNKPQRKRVERFIQKHSLKLVHSRCNKRTIIAGICRYVLMQESRTAGELRFNRSVFKFVGLTEPTYSIIKRNLDRLGVY